MKKTALIFVSIFVIFIVLLLGCKKASSPAANDPVKTATAVLSATITSTATVTATVTFTATATTGILVDDFEDDDLVSNIVCSTPNLADTYAAIGAVITSSGVMAMAGPVTGQYSYYMNATLTSGAFEASPRFQTLTIYPTTGSDFSAFDYFVFDYNLTTNDGMKYHLMLYNSKDNKELDYDFVPIADGAWHNAKVSTSLFTGNTLASAIPNITMILISGQRADSVASDVEIRFTSMLDNIGFAK